MILVERGKLRFLRGGGSLVVPNPGGRFRARRTYNLATTTKPKAAVCRVEVTELLPDGTMKVRLAEVDGSWFLTAKPPYNLTQNPALAAAGEPEAVPPDELERYSRKAARDYAADHAEQLAQRRGRSIGIQVKEAARRSDFHAFARLGHELVALASSSSSSVAVFAGTLADNLSASPSARPL